MRSNPWCALLVIVTAVSVAGCVKASPQQGPSSSSPAPTTTRARADAATIDLATKATITQADMGDRWTVHAPAKEADPVTSDSCAAGSPFADLPPGARQTGAQFQVKGARWFVYSTAAVFPDEAGTVRWLDTRRSASYVECVRADLEKEQVAADQRLSVSTSSTTSPGLGTKGFEAYTHYQLLANLGSGPQNANGSFARHTYRVGRTVVAVSIDIVRGDNDPPNLETVVSDDTTRAVSNVYTRIG